MDEWTSGLTEFQQEFLPQCVLRAAEGQAADEGGRVPFYGDGGQVCEGGEREGERESQ